MTYKSSILLKNKTRNITQLNRNLSIPSKAESSDQPSEWKLSYRSRKWEPVFPVFLDKRLAGEIVQKRK